MLRLPIAKPGCLPRVPVALVALAAALVLAPALPAQRAPDFRRLPTERVASPDNGWILFEASRPLPREEDRDRSLLRAVLAARGEGYRYVALGFGDARGFFAGPGEPPAAIRRARTDGSVLLFGYREVPRRAVRHEPVEDLAVVLARRLRLEIPPADAGAPRFAEPRFEIEARFRRLPARTADEVVVRRASLGVGAEAIPIGRAVELESPWDDPFREELELRAIAGRFGADAVVVDDDPQSLSDSRITPAFGWVAELAVRPAATLGIQWEPGERARRRHVVRRFQPDSLAAEAGLRLGDVVLAIDGVDLLDQTGWERAWMSWRPGQKVAVTVVRDGREERFDVETISNVF